MIRNLLFDYGKVLYEIDIQRMLDQFAAMRDGAEVAYSMEGQHEVFSLLEIGEVDAPTFAAGLKEAYQLNGSQSEILDAWNSLLVGVIPGRLELIRRCKERYDVALLSNTNAFHHKAFWPESEPLLREFSRCFFSFEMGMRKPDKEIYHAVLEEMNWKPGETLFIDDSGINIESAKEVGIQTLRYESEADMEHFEKAFMSTSIQP
ncbi:MAG: HAD family phosphatase [Bacteroidota bacterium]